VIRWAVATAFMLFGAAALARLPGYTVGEVWKNHVALDGKIIRVSGVVTHCELLGCSLLENVGPDSKSLSIGGSDKFDSAIQSRLGMPVVIEGRLDATCLHGMADRKFGQHGVKDVIICTDRASMLEDPRIVSSR